VFGPYRQQEPRTPDSVAVIGFATAAARKRNREKEIEESLGSSGSTLSSDDETFQPTKLDGAAAADFDQYSFEDNESELASLQRKGKISHIFTGGAAINQKRPGTVTVVSKKTPKPTVRIQDPPVIGNEIQETMMNSPVWNKYVEHFMLNYSHSCNPTRVCTHTHRHIQVPREPLTSRVCWRMCTLSQYRT
jgi:hypothetical protein